MHIIPRNFFENTPFKSSFLKLAIPELYSSLIVAKLITIYLGIPDTNFKCQVRTELDMFSTAVNISTFLGLLGARQSPTQDI